MIIDTNKIKNENKLYEKYNNVIKKYFNKYKKIYNEHDIIELSNDAFIKLVTNISRIENDELYIKKWLNVICKNIKIDFDRKKNKTITIPIEGYTNIIYEDKQFDFTITQKNEFLTNFIKYKKEGYKNNEISKIMKISERKLYREIQKNKKYVNF